MDNALTQLADLVNPEVLAPIVSYEFKNAMRFTPLASVDTTLQGRSGDTLKFPAFTYIGDAEDVAEGAAIPLDKLGTTTKSVTIKKAAKGTEITDEAVLSGYGDPVGESTKQLGLAIASKVDNDILAAALTATQTVSFGTTSDMVQSALTVFATNSDQDDSPVVALLNPVDAAALRKAARTEGTGSELAQEALVNGTKFEVLGVQIIESNKATAGQAIFIKINPSVPALKLVLKRSAEVENQRNIIHKTTVLTADEHYTAYLYDPTKVVIAKSTDSSESTGITLNQKTASIKAGATKQVTVSAEPVNATNANSVISATKFSSSDEAVATVVDDGTITGITSGSATITAISGAFTAEVAVTVTE